MRFWDASAIVALCVQQPASERATAYLREDGDVWVWWGTQIECLSAFCRLAREGALASAALAEARGRLDMLRNAWSEILPREAVRERAARALRIHGLKAADALQLASSLVWSDGRPNGRIFVTGDQRLGDAADLEGFAVVWTS